MTAVLLAATLVDTGVFAVSAVVVVLGALGVVFARNPVHSALCLVATLFGVAVLFVAQEAHFLAAVQVIVYAGAIVVLFLFVIMLLGVDREEAIEAEPLRGQRTAGMLLGAALLGLVVFLFTSGDQWATGTRQARGAASARAENVELLGRSLFTDFLLPFEVTGVLLVIAVVGAVVLARRPPRAEMAEIREAERAFSNLTTPDSAGASLRSEAESTEDAEDAEDAEEEPVA